MRKELILLREQMQQAGVDAYIIPTNDYHGSEYVGDFFKTREYVSGFTGSAGVLVVLKDCAGLWTDGRYFLQAQSQLMGSGIDLFRMGQPGVPKIPDYLADRLKKGQTVGYDGKMMMAKQAAAFRRRLAPLGISVRENLDLVGEIWKDRPAMSRKTAWLLDLKYAGVDRKDKIGWIRDYMKKRHADVFLLASLEDIAWLLNIRGDDIECTPVVLSYLMMTGDTVVWYVQPDAVPDVVRDTLAADGVTFAAYEQIYTDVAALSEGQILLFDSGHLNALLYGSIPDSVRRIDTRNPTLLMKAIKNPVEVANERKAHIEDGIAVTKFIYWLKQNVAQGEITEISAAKHLGRLRAARDHYIEDSFAPIIAYGKHGAIVHYSATETTDTVLRPRGFVLADTGGHYYEGTTDITRTIALGSLTQKEKDMYTTVLRCHIDLADLHFLEGCTGQSVDAVARRPLWDLGLDYNHGTGHGVGYLLSVHEGPNNFRYRRPDSSAADCILQEGMITSDEPGVYLEGEFGIRLENLIVCEKNEKNDFGTFLKFDPLTMVPFDREAIVPEQMTAQELHWLNAYHKRVYENIAPYLNAQEREWLAAETAEIRQG